MANANAIGLEAIFDLLGFNEGAKEYNDTIKESSSNTESAGSAMSATFDGLADVGLIAFEAIGVGIAAMTAALYSSVDAAMEAEEAMTRVNFIVDSTSERTGVTSEMVDELASSLSGVYPIDDEVIAQAIAMGLTFDGVNKDNIQPLLGAAADLAAFTGRDLPATMKSLSLAISDPEKAMRLLKEANITLTDAEMKTLKGFKDTGDAAGATTFILEQLKKKGITGLGKAMGDTATGKMSIMQTALGNLQEALGGGLLNALGGVFDRITQFANNPETIAFFTELGNKIGEFAQSVMDRLPSIMETIKNIVDWFANNKPVVIGVLAAIGTAMVAFGIQAAAAGISAMVGLAPIIAVMAAVGLVVGLLYKAWTSNWGGIQQKVAKAWSQMKPVFDKLQAWLAVIVPKAIKALADFWKNVLLPAIQTVVAWIVDNVLPLLVKLVLWLGENVPKAIKVLADFWNNVLLPAIKKVADFFTNTLIPIFNQVVDFIQGVFTAALNALSALWNNVLLPALTAVYNFISTYIMPIFNALTNLISAVLGVALRALAAIWTNILLPAIRTVSDFFTNTLMPIFTTVANFIKDVFTAAVQGLSDLWTNILLPALQRVWDVFRPFADFLGGVLLDAFNAIKDVIQWVVDQINNLSDALNNLVLPDWLTPGSPTPFEIGLRGINAELERMARYSLPTIEHRLSLVNSMHDVPGSSSASLAGSVSNSTQRTTNYLYGANFSVNNQSGVVDILQGLA